MGAMIAALGEPVGLVLACRGADHVVGTARQHQERRRRYFLAAVMQRAIKIKRDVDVSVLRESRKLHQNAANVEISHVRLAERFT
jgi:hypothetical protein